MSLDSFSCSGFIAVEGTNKIDDEEEIDNRIFENVDMLTGIPTGPPNEFMGDVILHNYKNSKYRNCVLYIALAYCTGFAACCRFPHIAYRNLNCAFVYPYIIMVFFTAYPICFIEMALGQYSSKGPALVFDYCPLLEGLGYTMTIFCLFAPFSIVMNMGYSVFYMLIALSSESPWTHCLKEPDAMVFHTNQSFIKDCSDFGPSEKAYIPVVYFWKNYVEGIPETSNRQSQWQWLLAISLILTWSLILYSIYGGIPSAYKVIHTILVPAICIILVFFLICLRKSGILEGLKLFLFPQWKELFTLNVWSAATQQALFSTGASSGTLITLGSLYGFQDKLIYKHVWLLALTSIASNVFMGMFFFMNMGMIFERYHITSLDEIFPKEMLRFWVFPHFWLFLFYFAMTIIESSSAILFLETFKLAIFSKISYISLHKTYWSCILCTIYLLVTLLNNTRGGPGIVSETMLSTLGRTIVPIAFVELVSVVVFYGPIKFSNDIEFMTESPPSLFLRISWFLNIFTLLIFAYVIIADRSKNDFKLEPKYLVTELLDICILLPIPIVMFNRMYTFWKAKNMRAIVLPRPTSGPKYGIWRAMRESFITMKEQKKLDRN